MVNELLFLFSFFSYLEKQKPKMSYQLEEDVDEDVNSSYEQDFGINFAKKFLNVAHSYRVTPLHPSASFVMELKNLKSYLQPKLEQYLENHKAFKLHVTLYCDFLKRNTNEQKSFHLDTRSRIVLSGELEDPLTDIFNELSHRIQTKLDIGSDYIYQKMQHADVLFLKYR